MTNRMLPFNFPTFHFKPGDMGIGAYNAFVTIVSAIKRMHMDLIAAINFNSIQFISQAAQPVPEEGRIILWHDSDASVGQPTHFLVVRTNGVTRTFRSVENA